MKTSLAVVACFLMIFQPLSFTEQALPDKRLALCGISYDHIGCGCSFKIKGLSCKNIPNSSDQHLFIEPLADEKEVLWLNNGGTEIKLQPINTNQIMSNPYSEQIGHYYNEELSVEIHSRPGQSTCPKDKAEDCEYVDVEASILITQKNGKTSKYNAIGACGC